MILTATLIKRPRKTHLCQGYLCQNHGPVYMSGPHIRAFCADDYREQVAAIRLCLGCAQRYGDDLLDAILVQALPKPPRSQDRSEAQKFADHYRAMVMWQDGIDEAEIAETLGLTLGEVQHAPFAGSDETIKQVRNMAHATAWPRDYRNHYVTGNDQDSRLWDLLVEWGLARKLPPRDWLPGAAFVVTEAGKDVLRELGSEVPRR